MRCRDASAEMLEPAAADGDQYCFEEEPPYSRRARFHQPYTEPVDKLDMDRVLSFLDQMDFKPSRNKVAAADVGSKPSVDSAMSAVSSNITEPTPASEETTPPHIEFSAITAPTQAGSSPDGTPPRAGSSAIIVPPWTGSSALGASSATAHIPRTVDGWKSLSSESCTVSTVATALDNCALAEALCSSPLKPVEYVSAGGTQSDHSDGQVDVFTELLETVADNFPDSNASSASSDDPVDISRQLDEVPGSDRASNAELQAVVCSPQLLPRRPVSQMPLSPGAIHTPRLLSADASYYLEQEDGDVIVECSDEEDFD